MAELQVMTYWQRARAEGRAEALEQSRAEAAEALAKGLELGRAEAAEALAKGLELGRAEAAAEAREIALELGKQMLRQMLVIRFVPPPVPDWVDERLAQATHEDLLQWGRMLAAGDLTLEQLFLS